MASVTASAATASDKGAIVSTGSERSGSGAGLAAGGGSSAAQVAPRAPLSAAAAAAAADYHLRTRRIIASLRRNFTTLVHTLAVRACGVCCVEGGWVVAHVSPSPVSVVHGPHASHLAHPSHVGGVQQPNVRAKAEVTNLGVAVASEQLVRTCTFAVQPVVWALQLTWWHTIRRCVRSSSGVGGARHRGAHC